LRPITVGDWKADGWFVTAGLTAGEQIVVDGGLRLTQGATVKTTPYVPPKAPPAPTADINAAASTKPSETTARHTAIYFASGDSSLDAAAIKTVRDTAAAMMGIGTSVALTGYADRTGAQRTNVDLAKLRAIAVRNALVGAGIDPRRIVLKPPVDVTGAGSDDKARRVDIGMTP